MELKLRGLRFENAGTGMRYPFGKNPGSIVIAEGTQRHGEKQTLYRDFAQTGADPGLQAIAVRELPKVEQTIAALDAL